MRKRTEHRKWSLARVLKAVSLRSAREQRPDTARHEKTWLRSLNRTLESVAVGIKMNKETKMVLSLWLE